MVLQKLPKPSVFILQALVPVFQALIPVLQALVPVFQALIPVLQAAGLFGKPQTLILQASDLSGKIFCFFSQLFHHV